MKITIVNIANKMPAWVNSGCDEYLQRINHGKYSCKLVELKADKNSHKLVLAKMEAEAKKFSAAIAKDSFVIALDEDGTSYSSPQFAEFLQASAMHQPQISFIIGGADGIHPQLLASANARISLSSLVFPHGLVRVILLEQLYRAISILEKHPYHRE